MTHRVKRMFSDRKLTAEERKSLPVFEDDCGIVWIPGFPLRDGLRWEGEGLPLTITYITADDSDSSASHGGNHDTHINA